MLATNHALSGALIGAFLPLPLALPVAFASHFVLDALPHYGIPLDQRNKSSTYRAIVYTDIFVALSIAMIAIVFRKWNMEIVGWTAYSPDVIWVQHYYKQNRTLHIETKNKFMEFHRKIQLFERPWGILVEITTIAVLLPLFVVQLLK